MGIQRLQRSNAHTLVDGAADREELIGERSRPGEEEQQFTPVHALTWHAKSPLAMWPAGRFVRQKGRREPKVRPWSP